MRLSDVVMVPSRSKAKRTVRRRQSPARLFPSEFLSCSLDPHSLALASFSDRYAVDVISELAIPSRILDFQFGSSYLRNMSTLVQREGLTFRVLSQ